MKKRKQIDRWQLGFEIPLKRRQRFRAWCDFHETSMKEVLNNCIKEILDSSIAFKNAEKKKKR